MIDKKDHQWADHVIIPTFIQDYMSSKFPWFHEHGEEADYEPHNEISTKFNSVK